MGTHGSSICIALYIRLSEKRSPLLRTHPTHAFTRTSSSDGHSALYGCFPKLPWLSCVKRSCKMCLRQLYPSTYDCFTMGGTPAVGVFKSPDRARYATHMKTTWNHWPPALSSSNYFLISSYQPTPGFSRRLLRSSQEHSIVYMRYTFYTTSFATDIPGPRVLSGR